MIQTVCRGRGREDGEKTVKKLHHVSCPLLAGGGGEKNNDKSILSSSQLHGQHFPVDHTHGAVPTTWTVSGYMQWRTLILTDVGRTYYINTDHPPITHKH
jgi:hypothetical protein